MVHCGEVDVEAVVGKDMIVTDEWFPSLEN